MNARRPDRPDLPELGNFRPTINSTDEFGKQAIDHARSECFQKCSTTDAIRVADTASLTQPSDAPVEPRLKLPSDAPVESRSEQPSHPSVEPSTEHNSDAQAETPSKQVSDRANIFTWPENIYYGKLVDATVAISASFVDGPNFFSGERLTTDLSSSKFHYSDTFKFNDPVPVQYDEHHFGEKFNYDIPTPSAEYDALAALAVQRIKNPSDRLDFADNLKEFHQRAYYEHLSPDEEIGTYKQISRIMDGASTAGLGPDQLSELGQQLIRQAAHPSLGFQGRHNTCGAVETWLNASHPSAVTKLVTDVALTGEFKAPDGTTVKIDTQRLDTDADFGIPSRVRSYASQLFQATAINLLVAEHPSKSNSTLVNGRDDNDGAIRYEEQRNFDRWKYYPSGSNTAIADDKFDGVDLSGIPKIGEIILGKKEQNSLLYGRDSGGNSIGFTSEQQLHEALVAAKNDGKLPLRIAMDTHMQPLAAGMMDRASFGMHMVTITDFQDSPSPKVLIHNGWSHEFPEHDRLRPVGLHDLYTATLGPQLGIAEIQKDVDAARATGKKDFAKEFYLLRLQGLYGEMYPTDEQVNSMTTLMSEMNEHWKVGVTPQQQRAESQELLLIFRDSKFKTSDVLMTEAVRLGLSKSPIVLSEAKKFGVTFPAKAAEQ